MPSGTSGLFGKMRFSDGEGIEHEDFNDLIHLLESRLIELDMWSGRGFRRVPNLAHANGDGIDPWGQGFIAGGSALDTDKLYTPYPYDGILSQDFSPADTTQLTIGGGILVYRKNANMQGTAPDEQGEPIICALEDDDFDVGANIVANAAPGSGNPRWDMVGVRVNYETEGSESRDFKDAVTDALSSQSFDKRFSFFTDYEFVTGSQAASYTPPTLATAGMVPLMTIERTVGEGATLARDRFYNHLYPMRLGIEDIPGVELLPGDPSDWAAGTVTDFTGITQVGGGTGVLFALPRQLHAGCRLVAVGVGTNGASIDATIEIVRVTYSSGGNVSITVLAQLDAGGTGPISTSQAGFQGAGESDWSSGLNFPLPIWGNGRHFGPWFSAERQSYATAAGFERLAIRIGNGDSWTAGDSIHSVRLIYLH